MQQAAPSLGRWICQAAVFIGAALLFQIQPLVAKRILPWFGASSAVWTTSILFFQSGLLAGYLYAHWLARRVGPSMTVWLHSAALIVSLAALPVLPAESWKPQPYHDPTARILLLLACTVGCPYLLLASTSTLVQSLWMRSYTADPPYRWYSLSNAGSLLGLLSYPFLIEPLLGLRTQAYLWSAGYVFYVVLMLAILFVLRRVPLAQQAAASAKRGRLSWIALPAIGSMLLLGTTSYLSENVVPVPFLWVLLLTAYLLSFVVSFGMQRTLKKMVLFLLPAVGLGALSMLALDPFLTYELPLALGLGGAGIFLVCFYLHREVYERRPAEAGLTSFYLFIAAGGALGAFTIAVLAPWLLAVPVDFITALGLSAVAMLVIEWRQGSMLRWISGGLAAAVLCIAAMHADALIQDNHSFSRNFYGTLRVGEESVPNRPAHVRFLTHGLVRHGSQILDSRLQRMPTAYYGYGSGISLAFLATAHPGQHVGVVGLGTGTIAAYGKAGDRYRFYELNPAVVRIAKSQFTYLSDSSAQIEIVLGDARLSLERETPQQFDLFILDAFSSDAIPAHLLTEEAFRVYQRHLLPNGALVFNTTNRALDIESLLAALASAAGLRGCAISTGDNPALFRVSATWVLLSRDGGICSSPKLARSTSPLVNRAGVRAWTDDYTSLWPIYEGASASLDGQP